MQTAVKESSILVPSSNDICAILEGRKTQIRTPLKKQPPEHVTGVVKRGKYWQWHYNSNPDPNSRFPEGLLEIVNLKSSYGKIGDKLWVRETRAEHPDGVNNEGYVYRATDPGWDDNETGLKWKPSIFMPRSASRITLEITGLRVERLQDISEEDAIAEGARRFDNLPSIHPYGQDPRWSMEEAPPSTDYCLNSARLAFANYWNKLNADRGYSWESNPWVWAVEFQKVNPA